MTQTITAATTAVASFGKEGYKIVYKNSSTVTGMTALSNGWYISQSTIPSDSDGVTILRNSDGKYNNAGGNNDYYKWNSSWCGPERKDPAEWVSSKPPNNSGYYTVSDSTALYLVYDPATDKIWTTETNDAIYAITIYVKDGTIRGSDSGTSANWGTSSVTGVSNNSYITNDHANN